MNDDYFTTTEVASVLNIPYWRIVYAHQSGQIPEPTLRIGNRRVYLREDLLRLAEHFDISIQTPLEDKHDSNNDE